MIDSFKHYKICSLTISERFLVLTTRIPGLLQPVTGSSQLLVRPCKSSNQDEAQIPSRPTYSYCVQPFGLLCQLGMFQADISANLPAKTLRINTLTSLAYQSLLPTIRERAPHLLSNYKNRNSVHVL